LVRKRLSRRFTLETSYTWANAVDNALNSSFVSHVQRVRLNLREVRDAPIAGAPRG
jgi:hypothetical protein